MKPIEANHMESLWKGTTSALNRQYKLFPIFGYAKNYEILEIHPFEQETFNGKYTIWLRATEYNLQLAKRIIRTLQRGLDC